MLAPLVATVFHFLPLDLDATQQTLAAVLLGVVVLWVCEPSDADPPETFGRVGGRLGW